MLNKIRCSSKRSLYILLIGILSGVFITLFSYSTSPLSPYYVANDSAFFRLVGQAMTKGMLPYRDIFDMKGPYMFLVEYVAQLICFGRYGIFIIQILNLWLVLYIADLLFQLYGITRKCLRLFLMLPVLSIAAISIPAGNYTEEFSLVPMFSCLYICARFFKATESKMWSNKKLCLAGAWFGLMLGILVFVRVTNASLIGGLMLAVIITLIAEKHAAGILPCAAGFIVGLFIALFPPIAFYWAKGLFTEFYEAVFVLGVNYATENSLLYHLAQTLSYNGILSALLLVLFAVCAIPIVFRWSSYKNRLILVFSGLFTFFAISAGLNFRHYYILMLPSVTLGVIALFQVCKTKSWFKKTATALTLAAIIILCPLYMYGSGNNPVTFLNKYQQPGTDEIMAKDVVSCIPDDEKDSVYIYNIRPYIYLYTDIYPIMKYCCWQEHYIKIMPQVEQGIREMIESAPPKWMLLKAEPGLLPDFLEDALATVYQEYYSNDLYVLYRLV